MNYAVIWNESTSPSAPGEMEVVYFEQPDEASALFSELQDPELKDLYGFSRYVDNVHLVQIIDTYR